MTRYPAGTKFFFLSPDRILIGAEEWVRRTYAGDEPWAWEGEKYGIRVEWSGGPYPDGTPVEDCKPMRVVWWQRSDGKVLMNQEHYSLEHCAGVVKNLMDELYQRGLEPDPHAPAGPREMVGSW